MNQRKPTIGFVGLGIMGSAMAKNAAKAGYPVVTTTRSATVREQISREGLLTVSSPKNVAETSDAIVIMVTDSKAVQEVLHDVAGVFEANVKGKTLIQMSTLDVKSTVHFSRDAEELGMKFLDCPVAGSKAQVEAGQLILLAGGDSALLDEWGDFLKVMGKAIVHAGEIGKGTALKLCMNLIVAQMTSALCESTALAKVLGVSPKKIFEVLSESPALNCGYFKIKEKALLDEDFTPAFSLNNMLKDVRFMDQAAKEKRLFIPVTQAVKFVMESAVQDGLGDFDLSVISKNMKPKVMDGGN